MSLSGRIAAEEINHSDAIAFEPDDGVLLIGHGTRDTTGTQQFFELGERLAARLAPLPVEPCLLELQNPSIEEGWQQLRARGVRRVLACPLLLFAAGHARNDIPQALDRCRRHAPEMSWWQSRPLSRAPELLQLVLKRLDASLDQATAAHDRVAILMVGRGSFDPCAQADMKCLTHWVAGQRDARRAAVGFYAMAHPKLPAALRRLATGPSVRSVIVQPHLLFEGSLYQAILNQVKQVACEFPDKQFIVSHYLGPESEVVEALVRRIATVGTP